MTGSFSAAGLGRYAYGLMAIATGICALAWREFANWQQIKPFVSQHQILTYAAATVVLLGGIAILLPRTARIGAAAVGAIYLIFALLGIPFVIAHPLVYNEYGNFFEQFSLFSGALIVYASCVPTAHEQSGRLARFGCYAFGVCLISFALEQWFYLAATASLVPRWIPPGQTFWAIATTAAFLLAGIAVLTGPLSKLASALTTAMLLGFGLLVWVPALFINPHSFANWSETVETFAIAASAWVAADYLRYRRA